MAVSIPKEGREVEYRADWATPKAVYDIINVKYGPFTLDPCASAENAKCKTFYTADDDGLAKNWAGHRCFVNPPYGRELSRWADKGVAEMCDRDVFSVFLIPPRVGTPWFQGFCSYAHEVHFLRGRVAFLDPAGKRTSPMDDNCLVVLDPNHDQDEQPLFKFWDWREDILVELGEEAYRSVGGR